MAKILACCDGLAQLLERTRAGGSALVGSFSFYAYPNRVTQKLLDTLAAHPRLAKYMDMPLQHASRNVLARMKRGSHGDAFLKLLERIRATIPGVSLRSSFIVGFPGETESDFRRAVRFCPRLQLPIGSASIRIFRRGQCRKLRAGWKVDPETITDRRNRLMAIQKKISREKLRAFKGRCATALVEGPSRDNPLVWEGRLEGMAPEIDGKLYLTDIETSAGDLATTGDAVRVEITKTDAYDLIGSVVEILPRPVSRNLLASSPVPAAETLTRITTGAPLRIL